MRHAILAPRPTLTSSRCQATLDVTTETISAGRGAIDAVIQVSTEEGVQGDVAVCTVEAVASSPLRTAGPGRTITQPGVDVNPSPSERWGGDGSDGEATVLDVEVSSEEEPATRGQPAALADALLTYLEVRPPPCFASPPHVSAHPPACNPSYIVPRGVEARWCGPAMDAAAAAVAASAQSSSPIRLELRKGTTPMGAQPYAAAALCSGSPAPTSSLVSSPCTFPPPGQADDARGTRWPTGHTRGGAGVGVFASVQGAAAFGTQTPRPCLRCPVGSAWIAFLPCLATHTHTRTPKSPCPRSCRFPVLSVS